MWECDGLATNSFIMANTSNASNKSLYGSIAMLIALMLSWFKVDVAAGQIEVWIGQAVDAVQVLLGIGGALIAVYGQWKANREAAK